MNKWPIPTVLVIGFQRTGTTALLRALGSSPDVHYTPEELSLPWFFAEKGPFKGKATPDRLNLLQSTAWGALFPAEARGKIHAVKTALSNTSELEQAILAIEPFFQDLKVVAVQRADLLAQAGSLQLASKTGRLQTWDPPSSTHSQNSPQVKVALTYIKWLAIEAYTYREMIHSAFPNAIWVSSEDLFQNFAAEMSRIATRLKVTAPLRGFEDTGKVSPDVADYVSNYPEARAFCDELSKCRSLKEIQSLPVPEPLLQRISRRLGTPRRVWHRLRSAPRNALS